MLQKKRENEFVFVHWCALKENLCAHKENPCAQSKSLCY